MPDNEGGQEQDGGGHGDHLGNEDVVLLFYIAEKLAGLVEGEVVNSGDMAEQFFPLAADISRRTGTVVGLSNLPRPCEVQIPVSHRHPAHESGVSSLDVSGRPQILFKQNLELSSGVGLVDCAGLDGGLPVRLIIGQEQISELHAHGKDVGFEFPNCTANRKGMLIDAFGLEQKLIGLLPCHDSEGDDKQQDDS